MTGLSIANVAPKGRKHLSADALFRLLSTDVDPIPDHRPATAAIALTEALLSACALCSLQSPSLLACDRERAAGNLHPIDGIQRVPCDTHMRERLAPVAPESLRPVCKRVVTPAQRGHALTPMRFLADRS